MPDVPVILHEAQGWLFDTDDPALASERIIPPTTIRLPVDYGMGAFFFRSEWIGRRQFKVKGGYTSTINNIYFEGTYTIQAWCPGDPHPETHDEPTMMVMKFDRMVLPSDVRTTVLTDRTTVPDTWIQDSWEHSWVIQRTQDQVFNFTGDTRVLRNREDLPRWLLAPEILDVIMAGMTDAFHQYPNNGETSLEYRSTFGVALNYRRDRVSDPEERDTIPDNPITQGEPVPPPTEEEEETDTCNSCGDEVRTINGGIGDGEFYCGDCFVDQFQICQRCGEAADRQWVSSVYTNSRYGTEVWCEPCYEWNAVYCDGCGDSFSLDHVNMQQDQYGDSFCPTCFEDYQDDEFCECDECMYDRGETPPLVRAWDYVPELVFHGRKDPMSTGPFFGMEIETAWPTQFMSDVEIVRWAKDEGLEKSDVIWVKSDSSVMNGYEIVTHPMTFDWAMEFFPWESFDKLIDKYHALDTDKSCGGHVHINKDSFSRSHLWKFIQFHVRMGDWCELMGGRDSAQWGALKGNTAAEIKKSAKSIAMTKRQRSQPRYQGLNFLPDNTVEMRYPAGGSSSYLIKKNLQLAHSIWTFTKETDVKMYQTGILDDAGYFLWWLEQRTDTYPDLVKYIRSIIVQPKAIIKEDI